MKAWAAALTLLALLVIPLGGCGSASLKDCLEGDREACYTMCRDGNLEACEVRDEILAHECRSSDVKACRFLCESRTRLHWSCYEVDKIQTAQAR